MKTVKSFEAALVILLKKDAYHATAITAVTITVTFV